MDQRVIDLYDQYVHGDMPRRTFINRVAQIVGGAAAAALVIPLIEPNYAHGQQVTPEDDRLEQGYASYSGEQGPVRAYCAKPAAISGKLPGVLVIHENRGLNAHIEDVARRAALAGYVAVAPDGLSYVGGAPEDQEAARDKFGQADRNIISADVIRGVAYLAKRKDCTGTVGSVGFCFGGGVSLQCAISEFPTAASVLFYGRALTTDEVARVKVPLLLHYAENDPRIKAGIPEFRQALDQHGVAYSLNMYPGTGHGFHNDTSAARYQAAAAQLAWQRTISFFDHYLKM